MASAACGTASIAGRRRCSAVQRGCAQRQVVSHRLSAVAISVLPSPETRLARSAGPVCGSSSKPRQAAVCAASPSDTASARASGRATPTTPAARAVHRAQRQRRGSGTDQTGAAASPDGVVGKRTGSQRP